MIIQYITEASRYITLNFLHISVIQRSISDKDDREIETQLSRLQTACQIMKGILRDCILVVMAINPVLLLLSDAIVSDNRFIRVSSLAASYGMKTLPCREHLKPFSGKTKKPYI
jgi:hypothetical protein